MREFPFSDRAAFWLGVAGVLAAIGIVPVTIAVAGKPPGADIAQSGGTVQRPSPRMAPPVALRVTA